MSKHCIKCETIETTKWHFGPMCRKCYRAQPHIKKQESQCRLKKKKHYNAVAKQYKKDNKEKIALKNKVWYENNKAKEKVTKQIYKDNNRNKINEYEARYSKLRKARDLNYRIRCNLRSRLSKAVRNKAGSAVRDLGCSIPDLIKHLESRFVEGMSWNNYGAWHIDHINALAKFDLTNPVQFKSACHYTNLQPLWAVDNMNKGSA